MMQSKGNNGSPLSFEQLVVGYEFPVTDCELDAPSISKYLEAVNRRREPLLSYADFVPPLAIAAYIMTALSKSFVLPPGSIHAAQEFEFSKLVPVGTTVSLRSKVAQKLDRGRLRLLMIQLGALDEDGDEVLSGKATLVLPS